MKSQVRIIGGKWRGRKLAVSAADGLRPTPDRIRETLFNWLGDLCRGAAVLDCFAGSGALGFEALSRGAARLVLLEQNRAALKQLRAAADVLAAAQAEIIAGEALASIAGLQHRFDLVFIDPPYAQPRLRGETFGALESRGLLANGALVYFEWPRGETFELPSAQLDWHKSKSAGQVNYAIAEWRATG